MKDENAENVLINMLNKIINQRLKDNLSELRYINRATSDITKFLLLQHNVEMDSYND